MIRFARTTSLLVTFALLISAATAHAECVWVLWEQYKEANWSPWTPKFYYESNEQCWAKITSQTTVSRDESWKTQRSPVNHLKDDNGVTIFFGPNSAYAYRCLPDTVDPRRPKGK